MRWDLSVLLSVSALDPAVSTHELVSLSGQQYFDAWIWDVGEFIVTGVSLLLRSLSEHTEEAGVCLHTVHICVSAVVGPLHICIHFYFKGGVYVAFPSCSPTPPGPFCPSPFHIRKTSHRRLALHIYQLATYSLSPTV